MLKTVAENILKFYWDVHFDGHLPSQIQVMNPFRESDDIRKLCHRFYEKYYSDQEKRVLILGINPGRLGAGATGIPFTDTKRLNDDCGIHYTIFKTHEPSSAFIYEMIHAFGSPEIFYKKFYINSVCPLGFVSLNNSKSINYNYYDSRELELRVRDFIIENIKSQIKIAGRTDVCFCLGMGKNYNYLSRLNKQYQFFDKIVPLEHPRYIMQYKNKEKDRYIQEYIQKLRM